MWLVDYLQLISWIYFKEHTTIILLPTQKQLFAVILARSVLDWIGWQVIEHEVLIAEIHS